MTIKNIEIQDHLGNAYHPHTGANVVFMDDGKSVQSVVGGGLTDTNIGITDKNNHFAATKLDGVLDELFTLADNGKKGIASVVGSPLTSSDTFGEQKNKIINLKYTFSKNLRNKGIDSNYLSDTLKNMIDKVEDISVESLGGKKWASGTGTLVSGEGYVIDNLAFKPSIILGEVKNSNYGAVYWNKHLDGKDQYYYYGGDRYVRDILFEENNGVYKAILKGGNFPSWIAFE